MLLSYVFIFRPIRRHLHPGKQRHDETTGGVHAVHEGRGGNDPRDQLARRPVGPVQTVRRDPKADRVQRTDAHEHDFSGCS